MTNKRNQRYWFIIIAVLIIIVLVVVFSAISSASSDKKEEEIKKRNEEEERLLKELEELERKREIYVKHEAINSFTEEYMRELCEKRYKQLIQVLLLLLVLLNVILYFTVPKVDVISQVTWNGIAMGLLNLLAVFFFTSVKKGKEYLKDKAMVFIEFRVYENRDKAYFTQKIEFYKNEIERLKHEINSKNDQLQNLR